MDNASLADDEDSLHSGIEQSPRLIENNGAKDTATREDEGAKPEVVRSESSEETRCGAQTDNDGSRNIRTDVLGICSE